MKIVSIPVLPFFLCVHLIFLISSVNIFPQPFEKGTDVGTVYHPGKAEFRQQDSSYILTGSGANIWGNEDAFFYYWMKAGGNITLSADIKWIGKGKNPHRKAGWMLRQSLDNDSPYIDAVIHGDGLTSMQYRKVKGGETAEVKSPITAPDGIILERKFDQYSLSVTKDGNTYFAGTISMDLPDKLYAGLVVCSHDSSVSETAIFSGVNFNQRNRGDMRTLESTLEVIDISTGIRTIIRRAKEHFEAPNWSRDGKFFIYNSNGKIYKLPAEGGKPELINTGFAQKCNNDHGLSPDGKMLAVSHHAEDGKSYIYVLPSEGGEPKLITKNAPSYWHGWSPDGRTLAYCAEREGEFDIYTIPVDGGDEIRLTTAPGLDDGPDYSPDGKYIYFNSVRTGQMKIWRMKSDGTEQIQFSPTDEYGDWFAHPSPDNRYIVFVSYDKNVEGHPANKDVVLRIMSTDGGEPKILANLFGGQGTINVPSWSPDSKKVAFVSYRFVEP